MKEIYIKSKKYGDHTLLVDDADFDVVNKIKWSLFTVKGQFKYAYNREKKLLHRYLLNPERSMVVDHIDGNGLNCQRSNMRVCTIAENIRNSRLSKRSTTGYKGVYHNQQVRRYLALIIINKKRIHIGYYRTAELAAEAYNNAAIIHHGEFAKLNSL
jgi:hypothetical protein